MTTSALASQVIVVDVCGTLVRDDTTLGLLRHHFSRASAVSFRGSALVALTARFSPLRLGFAVLERLTGRHWLKHAAVRLLAGCSVDALERSAEEYAAILLASRKVPSVWNLLESRGFPVAVILASASLEPVVRQLAATTGGRYVASTLEQQGGVLTGRYASDLTGRKLQALQHKFGASLLDGGFSAISDNRTDRALLQRAAGAYVVLHREGHRGAWAGLEATFLGFEE